MIPMARKKLTILHVMETTFVWYGRTHIQSIEEFLVVEISAITNRHKLILTCRVLCSSDMACYVM